MLRKRLERAKCALDEVNRALGRHPGTLPSDVEDSLRTMASYVKDIDDCIDMLETRKAARQFLSGLESAVDPDDCVPLGSTPVKYHHARLIGLQAYMAITWALADKITHMVGHVLCTPETALNPMARVQLLSHFVNRDKTKKTTATTHCESIRQTFGWPIGLSYAIRNHLVHEGAQSHSHGFFESNSPASGFRVSPDGWSEIERRTEDNKVDQSCHRVGAAWPADLRVDLRVTLDTCEREMDDALGVLIVSAFGLLRDYAGLMLGEDR